MKKKWLLCVCLMASLQFGLTQNLVLNPGGESSPNGTLWTIVSSGGTACAAGSAANTYSNWTMTPDNSTNYPAAHGGTKTFFSGCSSTVPAGPFELFQDISVVADATSIDGGFVSFNFSGYMQTPVSPQADAGRFIVDFLNTGGAILGTSYTSAYQSYAAGSGSGWIQYTHTRIAPSGTRKLRVRLQSTISTGPAVNSYFDDISITKTVTLPVVLESFKGAMVDGKIRLAWQISDAMNFLRFEVERSRGAGGFLPVANINFNALQDEYTYDDPHAIGDQRVFYRLKLLDIDGKISYSEILAFNSDDRGLFRFSPNPAISSILVTGLRKKGTIGIVTLDGKILLQSTTNSENILMDISMLPVGIYILSYNNNHTSQRKKLIIQR